MRLYGVLTTLGIAVVALAMNTQTAHAETSTGRSLLLAQHKSKLTTQKNAPLLAVRGEKALLAKAAETPDADAKKTKPEQKAAAAEPKPADQPVYATVAEGDSLAIIAERYGTTWDRIFDANESLSTPNIINAGQKLRIPRAEETLPNRSMQVIAAQQAASVAVVRSASTTTTRSYTSKPLNSSSYYVGNGMWCTDYVHSRRPDIAVYGNAGYNWISSAQAAGKSTGGTPRTGAIAVTNGHVAYVESVNGDGSYTVSEMGWNYRAGNYNKRTVRPGTFGQFIY